MENHKITVFTKGDAAAVQSLYYEFRSGFLQFGKRYQLSDEILIDIYQDAFVALRKNALNGTLEPVQSSMKTYLYGIGKHLIFNELKRNKKFVSLTNIREEKIEQVVLEESFSLTTEQILLRTYFQKLGKKCRLVLTLFYYRGLSIKEIVKEAGYNSENVVRSQKSRCLRSLKEAINSDKR